MAEERKDEKKPGALKELVQAEQMLQLAIAIPLGCVVGWLLGNWADRAWHQNWIGVAGIVLGAVGGFIQIYEVAKKYMKDSK